MRRSRKDKEARKKYIGDKAASVSTSLAQESGHKIIPLPLPTPFTKEIADLSTLTTARVTTVVIKAKEASHDSTDSQD